MRHNNFRKYLILIFGIFLIAWNSNLIAQSEIDILKKEIQIKLDSIKENSGFPGATLAFVLEDGTKLNFATGFSDVDNNIPMKPDDIMFTGSTGKTFVSAVVMQMYDESSLDFDEKISHYFGEEEWFSKIANSSEITIEMLLTHTGGLPRYVMKEEFWKKLSAEPDKIWKPEETLSYIFDEAAVHEAGKGWSYSDTDYIIIGMIIEKVTGNSYYDEVTKRIIKPLGLDNTFPSNKRAIKGLIPGLTGPGPWMLPDKPLVDGKYVVNPQFEWCGGGLVTTSPDLASWAKNLYEAKVFSSNTLDKLLVPHDFRTGQPAKTGYGFGVFVFDTPSGLIYSHAGIFPGYETSMMYLTKFKTSLAFQVNADSFSRKLNKPPDQILFEFIPLIEKYYSK